MSFNNSDLPNNPKYLWEQFFNFNKIPRPSRKEERLKKYIMELAQNCGNKFKEDSVGNLVVYVPATKGMEKKSTVIIQNHLDMVCDATPTKKINFEQDGIEVYRDGDWIRAKETTLGADNGIGAAAALALMLDPNIKHPPLELLFTIDEETGLNGALNLDPTLFSGKKLLNLDSEDWGQLIIGCAGGVTCNYMHTFSIEDSNQNKNLKCYKLELTGLVGGHSGIDIHRERGNSHKIIADALFILNKKYNLDLKLVSWKGGKAHNIIPREVVVTILIRNDLARMTLEKYFEEEVNRFLNFLPIEEQKLKISVLESEFNNSLSQNDSMKFLGFVSLIPHGAYSYIKGEDVRPNLVNLSSNLAQIDLDQGKLKIVASIRFMDKAQVVQLKNQYEHLGKIFGIELNLMDKYPSWRPNLKSQLLREVKAIYEEMYHEKPIVTSIHAGLECGIIGDKFNEIDMISFGPTILGAHSPTERVQISTVEKFWTLLVRIIEKI